MSPKYNQQRTFKRGEVFMVNFPAEPQKGNEPSRLLKGPHRAIVLFDSVFPRKTVVVVPISSILDKKGKPKPLISSDVLLAKDDYINASEPNRNTITVDSFIMTNQIRSVSRNYLGECKGMILDKDMIKLDIQLITTLNLHDTINQMIEMEVQSRLEELGIDLSQIENTDEIQSNITVRKSR